MIVRSGGSLALTEVGCIFSSQVGKILGLDFTEMEDQCFQLATPIDLYLEPICSLQVKWRPLKRTITRASIDFSTERRKVWIAIKVWQLSRYDGVTS